MKEIGCVWMILSFDIVVAVAAVAVAAFAVGTKTQTTERLCCDLFFSNQLSTSMTTTMYSLPSFEGLLRCTTMPLRGVPIRVCCSKSYGSNAMVVHAKPTAK